MTEASHEDALRALEHAFGDRIKRDPAPVEGLGPQGALASVLPMDAGEVQLLAEVAKRFSVPLVALGGGTIGGAGPQEEGSVLVSFDLMSRTLLPEEEPWVEAEPGASWLQLDDGLRVLGRGLAVYPTSAPRATVGGWLATDGLGVGSFEYGWLRENVLSASVVLAGGELVEAAGEEVRSFVGPQGAGIVVGAKLRTRRAEADVPFGAAFGAAGELARAATRVLEARLPLWHLALLNRAMARARNLGEAFVLFGAYPMQRRGEIEGGLRSVVASCGGRLLSAADAHRVWGERFFPITPSSSPARLPSLSRELSSLAELSEKLDEAHSRPERLGVQGTVANSGEVLLLTLEVAKEDSASR